MRLSMLFSFFFFNDTATTEIYTLSLHDALPISIAGSPEARSRSTLMPESVSWFSRSDRVRSITSLRSRAARSGGRWREKKRSEEHTSELQSQSNLVCRLLLEKKKQIKTDISSLT